MTDDRKSGPALIAGSVGAIFTMAAHPLGAVTLGPAQIERLAIVSVFQVNQTFAGIFTVAASVALMLWSASALWHGGLGRGIANCGCILSPPLILAICSGHVRLDVHGMAIVAVAQAIWFIGAGTPLYGQPTAARLQAQA